MQRLDTEAAAPAGWRWSGGSPRVRCSGIAPFNFPLNLVAHKVAPAIAVGAPILVKPAPATPLSALLLGELLAETDLPRGMWSVLPVPNDADAGPRRRPAAADHLVHRLRAGRLLRSRPCPRKHVVLELGGNAAAVVLADFGRRRPGVGGSADRDLRQLPGRSVVHLGAAGAGRPIRSTTTLVPMVVEKVQAWSSVTRPTTRTTSARSSTRTPPAGWSMDRRGRDAGANLLTGGERDGAHVAPAVLVDVPADAKVACEEVFGPVRHPEPGRRRRRRGRHGQRLALRAAGRRVHPRPADGVPAAPRPARRRRGHR